MEWYLMHGERRVGPMSEAALRALAAAGKLTRDTLVWHAGMAEWTRAEAIPGLVTPPPAPHVASAKPSPETDEHSAPAAKTITGSAEAALDGVESPARPGESADEQSPQDEHSAAESAVTTPLASPWRRYWAWMLDITLASALIGVFVGAIWPGAFAEGGRFGGTGGEQLFGWLMLPFVMVLLGVAIALFGTTPGKALAGIRTVGFRGDKLQLGDAIQRNFSVWWYGLGTGFPIVTLVTLVAAYQDAGRGNVARWERSSGARSYATPGAARTWLTAICWLVILLALTMLGQFGKENARQVTEAVPAASPPVSSAEQQLAEAAEFVRQRGPVMIDADTRLDSVDAVGTTFTYRYSLVRFAAADFDAPTREQLRAEMRRRLHNAACVSAEMKPMRDLKATIAYSYVDSNGVPFETFTFNEHDCALGP